MRQVENEKKLRQNLTLSLAFLRMVGYIQTVKQKNDVLYLKNGQSRYESCYIALSQKTYQSLRCNSIVMDMLPYFPANMHIAHLQTVGFSKQHLHNDSDPKLRDLDKFFCGRFLVCIPLANPLLVNHSTDFGPRGLENNPR
jgi:hypothetical protein